MIGLLLALGALGLASIPNVGTFFVAAPIFFISFLGFSFPPTAQWFLGAYCPGLVLGRLFFHHFQDSWIAPEILAMLVIFLVPTYLLQKRSQTKNIFSSEYNQKKKEFDDFQTVSEKL